MNNIDALKFFHNLGKKNATSGAEKNGLDATSLDAAYLKKYCTKDCCLLDLGSGTGLILQKIVNYVSKIDALEPVASLSSLILTHPNIKIISENVFDYSPIKKYDLITMFGFMHYFESSEASNVYKLCASWLKADGTLIVKNQFGLGAEVVINGFSSSLGSDYFANYRTVESERILLEDSGFKVLSIDDIYPKEFNKWSNTHYYAISAILKR